ncbi:MAG TPA: NAD(P)-dependent alcohol dehydrogenase [Actinomycetota bacterium]|nr:NAD(P)-dependent alcohol dehydrogenase [Actinomycetota bacterium]
MKAYRFVEWQKPPELVEVPVPEPGPGEVLIKVGGSGACHSDLHIMDWPEGQLPWRLPFTLGHETAGWVADIGAGVTGVEVGEAVAVYGPWGCGQCHPCRQGMENYCARTAEIGANGGGLGLDGGMAEYMLVPSPRLLVPLYGMDPVAAAPLGDAALTPYHAIKRSLGLLVPGTTAVVVGVGGLGHMAVQILRALSPARIVAVDVAEDKLELAQEIGADHTVVSDEEAAERIRAVTFGRGAEAVFDFVGTDTTIALGAKVARAQGHLTVVGLGMGTFPFNFFSQPYEVSLATTYWGSVTELMEVIALAGRGKIEARMERFPLEKAPQAYEKMRAGALDGRAVIVPV